MEPARGANLITSRSSADAISPSAANASRNPLDVSVDLRVARPADGVVPRARPVAAGKLEQAQTSCRSSAEQGIVVSDERWTRRLPLQRPMAQLASRSREWKLIHVQRNTGAETSPSAFERRHPGPQVAAGRGTDAADGNHQHRGRNHPSPSTRGANRRLRQQLASKPDVWPAAPRPPTAPADRRSPAAAARDARRSIACTARRSRPDSLYMRDVETAQRPTTRRRSAWVRPT